jgi:hypothetical protein
MKNEMGSLRLLLKKKRKRNRISATAIVVICSHLSRRVDMRGVDRALGLKGSKPSHLISCCSFHPPVCPSTRSSKGKHWLQGAKIKEYK